MATQSALSPAADVLRPRGLEQHKRLNKLFRAGDWGVFDSLVREHLSGTRDSYAASLKALALG
jgi:DNA-binding GntR family transcriptional regulator